MTQLESDHTDASRHTDRTAAEERDRVADQRDLIADAREAAWTDREAHVDSIFAAAALRDDRAAIRDFEADQRDMQANLEAFVNDVDDSPAFEAREAARANRLHAKSDRVAAEVDRYVLSDLGPTPEERESALNHRISAAVDRIEAASGRQHAKQVRDSTQAEYSD
jgi:hypothetical protein